MCRTDTWASTTAAVVLDGGQHIIDILRSNGVAAQADEDDEEHLNLVDPPTDRSSASSIVACLFMASLVKTNA